MYDGNSAQVEANYRAAGGATYPLLLKGSGIGIEYGFGRHNFAVVDHEGILRYRSSGIVVSKGLDVEAIRSAVEASLAALPVEEESPPEIVTLVEEFKARPGRFALGANYPNPFNARTTIHFRLPGEKQVSLRIYDINGRYVRELLGTSLPAGEHTLSWDGTDRTGKSLASGVYLYRLEAAGEVLTRKMLLLQ